MKTAIILILSSAAVLLASAGPVEEVSHTRVKREAGYGMGNDTDLGDMDMGGMADGGLIIQVRQVVNTRSCCCGGGCCGGCCHRNGMSCGCENHDDHMDTETETTTPST